MFKRFAQLSQLVLSLLVLASCSKSLVYQSGADSKKSAEIPLSVERENSLHLNRDYAAMRAKQVSQVKYKLWFKLDEKSKYFSGRSAIDFELAENNTSDLTVDFNGGEVQSVSLNGKAIPWEYNNYFIRLGAEDLTAGKNILEIEFTRAYSSDGDGLHRFQDGETGRVYLYTNFEPYNANKLFPHFDQPNIKAPYTLEVEAPAHWKVISSTRENRLREEGEVTHWSFPQSVPISSYIFSLHAGPWHVWEDRYEDAQVSIPLRLFARQEVADYVVLDEWFTPTKQSFGFFNAYFELPYPFLKYDQVIVPDFNAGAMENLAAVTFAERFVSRGAKVEAQKIRLGNIIAHEMAHMWFGDLVTMDWWNGLWLNESFATYMAYLQQARASNFTNTWNVFYARAKQRAYKADQQVTTHAIELPVETTADAFANFDGITYGKGASVLKQLPYFLGEENFRKGVANYLKTHSYGNTELEDFIGALAKASGMDLSVWTQDWLYKAGLNSIKAEFHCEQNKLSSLTLLQEAKKTEATLRQQRTQLGLFKIAEDSRVKKIAALPVYYEGERTRVNLKEYGPLECPDMVYPNFEDWAYVKVILDEKSRTTLMAHIGKFYDTGLRIMLWQSLWDAVLDQRLGLDEYVNFALKNLPSEKDERINIHVHDTLSRSIYYYQKLAGDARAFNPLLARISESVWLQLQDAAGASDRQKLLFDYWALFVSDAKNLGRARELLTGRKIISGLQLDQDRRWSLVLKLNEFAYSDYITLTSREEQRDNSDRGVLRSLAAEATRPDKKVKEKWLAELAKENSRYKLSQLSAVMQHLFPASQNALHREFSGEILDALPRLVNYREERFLTRYARALAPAHCIEESVSGLEDAIEKYQRLSPGLGKHLRIQHEEDQRCVDIGELINAGVGKIN